MKKILITGGNGFLGRNILEQLNSKYEIHAFGREKLDLLNIDNCESTIKNGNYDIIIHTAVYDAAPQFKNNDIYKVLDYNLQMFYNIVRLREYYGKLIHIGSGSEFDRTKWNDNMSEEYFDKNIPSDFYGLSKYIMNKHIQTDKFIYNLRLFAPFGKYEDYRVRFISNALCRTIKKLPIVLNKKNNYDFLYVDDVVKIIDWFINNSPTENIFNVCSGECRSFYSVINLIHTMFDDYGVIDNSDDIEIFYGGDNKKILNTIPGLELSPFVESINKLYEYYNSIDINLKFLEEVK